MHRHDTPDEPAPTPAPFGKRFGDTWKLLQSYLADLDEGELETLAGSDFERTLELLSAQPELGRSGALDEADPGSPEQLALRIVAERLRALTERLPEGDGEPWGSRFLSRWRALGGPLAAFPYSQLQAIKQADEATTLRMFRSRVGGLQVTRVLQGLSPEAAADLLERELALRQMTIASILVL